MTEMTCANLDVLVGELAAGVVTGEDRAAALRHLETCASCRLEVGRLTEAAEELLLLAPAVEPSAGFEHAVLAKIERLAASGAPMHDGSPHRRRPPGARLLAVAAAIVVAVLAGGLWVAMRPTEQHAIRTAEMRVATGEVVGKVTIEGDPASIELTIPDWAALVRSYGGAVDAPYWVTVQRVDGTRDIHRLPAPDDPWHVEAGTPTDRVAAVSILDNGGIVWCTAQFST